MNMQYDIYLALPRGFCAGVERAIQTVENCLKKYDNPVYVLHEIVHNKHVISELQAGGAIFVEHLAQIPKGGIAIFSAHGVSKDVEKYADELGLRTVNATCPLVTRVHRMVEKYHEEGCETLIIGHHNHPEVEGTAGRVENRVQIVSTVEEAEKVVVSDPDKVGFVTQTTLAKKDIEGIIATLKRRFPNLRGPKSNICFATQNRQDAVKMLADKAELIFVVGSKNSSNSNRLREVAERAGAKAYLIDDYNDIKKEWLTTREIGITAGASAPERLVEGVITWFSEQGEVSIQEINGVEENIHFPSATMP